MRNQAGPGAPEKLFVTKAVVFACAVRTGFHAGLVPAHLSEEPRLGVAFVVAVVLLAASVAALTKWPGDRKIARAVALLLAGLIAGYAATRTTGVPWLAPDPEELDAVGLATNVVEALGLAFALWLGQPGDYGRAAGNKLTTLLKEHILGAVSVLVAAKSGDPNKLAQAEAAWFANGRQIADFLHAADSRFLSRSAARQMMRIHLNQVIQQGVDELKGNYLADARAFAPYIRHILAMADMISGGIIKQFPSRFS